MISVWKEAALLWYDRDADHLAAAVSYYTLFAVAPLVFLSLVLMDVVYDRAFVIAFFNSIGLAMGPEVVWLIERATSNLIILSEKFWVPLFGALFFSGMLVVLCNTITSSIHHLWGIPHKGFRGWIKKSWNAISFLVVFEVYLLILMAFSAVLHLISYGAWLTFLLNGALFLAASTTLFALAYRILPWVAYSLQARVVGALTASVLLVVVKIFVTWYLSITPFPALFESAGIVMVLLMWVFASVSVFFYGAAVAHIFELRADILSHYDNP